MFTGIVTDVGEVRGIEKRGDERISIWTAFPAAGIDLGASIACAGVCLTVVMRGVDDGRSWFAVDVSGETLSKTTIGAWRAGTKVNLERALKVGDELGGHIVSGHVDGVARVRSLSPEGASRRIVFDVPGELARYIAPKGSIALDGVSLTVNEVGEESFGVNIIPHTALVTTFGALEAGGRVNLEVDVLARYVARLQAA
ncbi:MAG: riboflavin synthase [Alphaproteobacteria bacterium]|nr:riboflavin synthase [Alphaproteobacteria bacterium]